MQPEELRPNGSVSLSLLVLRGVLLTGACLCFLAGGPADARTTPEQSVGAFSPADERVKQLIVASERAYAKGQLLLAIIQAKSAVHLAPFSGLARAQLGI